jgi:2-keto-4-pentenoate hydratase/2-oxohepta-3-ene-1,7-dioic acid hydratase in catechol pathway
MAHIYRVRHQGEIFHAVAENGELRRATPRSAAQGIFGGHELGAPVVGGLDSVQTLAPTTPSKIVCVGLNYKDHAAESGKPLPPEPLLFLKPPSGIINPGDTIRLPPDVGRVDYEAELAVVIGRRAHRIKGERAFDYIYGFTCLNDVTARDMQRREPQYTRAKGFDTFGPFGPCIDVDVDAKPRAVEGFVNGERRQSSHTGHLIFPIEHLLEYITFVMTLEPGDIVSTGTPEGVGPLKSGDTVTVRVEGVGELINRVQAE